MYFNLHTNQLSGEIPPEIENLENLVHLYLFNNQLSGEVPSTLGNLINVGDFKLFNNNLSGQVPESLCNLTADNFDYFHGNNLCPPYPDCLLAEEFEDLNGNGEYDGDEYFEDSNENGEWDEGEEFEDWNENGEWDEGEPFTDADNDGEYDHDRIGYQDTTNCEQVSTTDEPLPITFKLHNAYPNPFNPVTTLRYDLPEDAMVNITIYDMMGRVVNNLVSSQLTAGYKSVQWNATNNTGQPVSAGLYIYTIQTGDFRQTRKMVLLK